MYLYQLNSLVPRWKNPGPSQRGPKVFSFMQQRKRSISILTFISQSDEAGYMYIHTSFAVSQKFSTISS